MIFNSLKTRIAVSVTGIAIISLLLTVIFFQYRVKNELSSGIEENALNLMEATKNHVESQYNSIKYYKSVILTRRKTELKNSITIAFSMIENSYRQFENGQISENEAKQQATNYFRELRYDDGIGYFWINDSGHPYPRMVIHPTIPELEGTILDDPDFNCALGKNENLFKAFVDITHENQGGYVDYLWPKPLPGGLTGKQPKISYVKLFQP
ncbi:MAG: cache domain-containing protein, partial [Spirochaetales bacterium]|nr:cache domain-containing protein [Spirochaetales bacterium]